MSFEEIGKLIECSGKKLGLGSEIIGRIVEPQRIVEVSFPVKMDSGKVKVFKGYRVQHNNARGPFKGGIRFHPSVNLEEVEVLAGLMSLKTALINVPFGGGKGAVAVEPRELSRGELKRLTQSFARAIYDVIGEQKDIPAPDVNTHPLIMKWFRAEYEKLTGQVSPGVITGKAFRDGGIKVRDEATGLGGAAVTDIAAREILKTKPHDITVAIQGFGNVGNHIAHHLYHAGYRIVAIADIDGGVVHEDGLDYHATYKMRENGRKLPQICCCNIHGPSDDCASVGAQELLESKADILIPAAVGDQITTENAAKVKAKIIIEMANHPVSEKAEAILSQRGIVIIPDILANAGGVLASYLEWRENVEGIKLEYKEAKKYLIAKMRRAYREVTRGAKKDKVSLRQAAYMIAIKRIATALGPSCK